MGKALIDLVEAVLKRRLSPEVRASLNRLTSVGGQQSASYFDVGRIAEELITLEENILRKYSPSNCPGCGIELSGYYPLVKEG